MDSDPRTQSPADASSHGSKKAKFFLGLVFIAGWVLFTFDICAPTAWSFLMLGTGLFLAVQFTRSAYPRRVHVTLFALCIVPAIIIVRMLPVHSLEWSGIDRVEVARSWGEDRFEVTDPADLGRIERFGARGRYGTMLKSGFGYSITVWKGGIGEGYYVHGNCFGKSPGGVAQSAFFPADDSLMDWFEDMLERHGHPKHRKSASSPARVDE